MIFGVFMNNYQLSKLALLKVKYNNTEVKNSENYLKNYLFDYISELGSSYSVWMKNQKEEKLLILSS